MKSHAELLQNSDIPTDDLPGLEFTSEQMAFLAVAEGVAFYEWERVAEPLGIVATAETVSENYDGVLQRAGRWTLSYATSAELNYRA